MSEKRYCIRTPEGKLLVDSTLSKKLKECVADFEAFNINREGETWSDYYKLGYRGVKVEIKEITK